MDGYGLAWLICHSCSSCDIISKLKGSIDGNIATMYGVNVNINFVRSCFQKNIDANMVIIVVKQYSYKIFHTSFVYVSSV